MASPKLRAFPAEAFRSASLFRVAYRSAPAHDNILLIRVMWYGCTRTRRWNASFPAVLTTYLLAQIRAASSASDESCSYSSETRWQQKGKSSTDARFRPRS